MRFPECPNYDVANLPEIPLGRFKQWGDLVGFLKRIANENLAYAVLLHDTKVAVVSAMYIKSDRVVDPKAVKDNIECTLLCQFELLDGESVDQAIGQIGEPPSDSLIHRLVNRDLNQRHTISARKGRAYPKSSPNQITIIPTDPNGIEIKPIESIKITNNPENLAVLFGCAQTHGYAILADESDLPFARLRPFATNDQNATRQAVPASQMVHPGFKNIIQRHGLVFLTDLSNFRATQGYVVEAHLN